MILRADNISVKVAGRDKPILSSVNIVIEDSEFVIVLGANGSGKSTLIKTLSGEITPSSGIVSLNNQQITKLTPEQKAIDFIMITQSADERLFVEMTLEENIKLWESRTKIRLAYNILPAKFAPLMQQKLCNFSGGEKQDILLHLALAHPPQILFLDEHTSALDHKAAHDITLLTAKQIAAHRITTIMVTHRIEDAVRYGDRVIIMSDGRVIYDQKKGGALSIERIKELMYIVNHTNLT